MEDFDKSLRKEDYLINSILKNIENVKYLRNRIYFSDLDGENKEKALNFTDTTLYWMAYLTFNMSRYNGEYRYKSLEYFKTLTKNKGAVGMSSVPSNEDILEHIRGQQARLDELFNGNKSFFKEYSSTVQKIQSNLNSISYFIK